MRIVVPTMPGVWGIGLDTLRCEEEKIPKVMEVDSNGYFVYCKRGKRGHMKDRFCVNSKRVDIDFFYLFGFE